jgi:hypothetical protein
VERKSRGTVEGMGEIKNAQKIFLKKYDEWNREGSRWVNNIDPQQPSGCFI